MAEQALLEQCGSDMDTWIVGRHPISVQEISAPSSDPQKVRCAALKLSAFVELKFLFTQIFFFKGHIFSGQAHPDGRTVQDFAWLTKDEVRERVTESYFSDVKDLLSDV